MIQFVVLRAKPYDYLIDDGSEVKKAKWTKTCIIKRKLEFENSKNCLEATKPDIKKDYLEQNEINVDSVKQIS